MQQSFEVIIIGRGITGLSTAWHLKGLGFRNVCIVSPPRTQFNSASLNAGYASVSLHDNITRAAHGLGSNTASELLGLNRVGFQELTEFARLFDVDCRIGQVFRVSGSQHEDEEMAVAVDWLRLNGFPASMEKSEGYAIQKDGAAAASLDIVTLLNRLETAVDCATLDSMVQNLDSKSDHIVVELQSGQKLRAEVVVLACHTGIKSIIPTLSSSFVNHADQWMEFDMIKKNDILSPGNLIFSGHSQFWISPTYRGTLAAGGCRYLRKWAGVEAEDAPVMDEVIIAVKEKIESQFSIKLSKQISAQGIIDIRTCDEIPVIGPMYGDSRILLASGYMGTGLTFGFAAGKGLSDFIHSGSSKIIPRVFHPSRLRSLPEID